MGGVLSMTDHGNKIRKQICPLQAPRERFIVENLPDELLAKTEEIRLRHSRPLIIIWAGGESYLGSGGPVATPWEAYQVDGEDLEKTLE